MENWRLEVLEKLVEIDPEQLSNATDKDYSFYYIDISSVSSGMISFPSSNTLFIEAPSRARKILRDRDVLMSTVRPNLKAFARFNSPDNNSQFIASTGFAVLRQKNNTDIDFIYHSLFSSLIENQIMSLVVGSNYPALNTRDIRKLKIFLPKAKSEQTKIAFFLSTIDESIKQTENLIEKYQRLKIGMMHDLLSKGIDAKGNIRSKVTHKFVIKKGVEVPEEWNVNPFKDLCELIKDGTHLPPRRVENGILLLGVSNIIKGEWKTTTSDTQIPVSFYNEMHKNWKIEIGDVLLAIVGATIGKVTQVPREFPIFTLQRSVCLLRGKSNRLSNDYLRLFIESSYFQRVLWNDVNVTAQPGVYLDSIGRFLLPEPSYSEQLVITSRLNSVKNVIDNLIHNLTKLQALKAGLMQDLLTGKVRMK